MLYVYMFASRVIVVHMCTNTCSALHVYVCYVCTCAFAQVCPILRDPTPCLDSSCPSFCASSLVLMATAMVLQSRRPRLVADPDVSVADCVHSLEDWLRTRATRDITALLGDLRKGISVWKMAPSAALMASLADLFELLFTVAPNTVVKPSTLKMALVKMHRRAPVNYSSRELEDWAYDISADIRGLASKFKEVFECGDARARCLRKAKNEEGYYYDYHRHY